MAYQKPDLIVRQRVTSSPTPNVVYQLPYLIGGDAQLILYDSATTKPTSFVGEYTGTEIGYLWPDRQTGAMVDTDYAKLFVENGAFLWASTMAGVDDLSLDNGNILNSTTLQFASNGGFVRSPIFKGRDVRVGDVIKLEAVNSTLGAYTLVTEVMRLLPEGASGSTAPDATADAANAAASTDSLIVTKTNDVSAVTAVVNGSYDGRALGLIEDVYTVKVIRQSTGGDFTTALMQVTTQSGLDQVDSVVPASLGVPFAIGNTGIKMILGGVAELAVGDTWSIAASSQYTPATVSSEGTYNGTKTTTYVIAVSKGGDLGTAVLQAAAVDGTDLRTGIITTGDGLDITIQSGMMIDIAAPEGLVTGDRFYLEVTGADATAGPINRLVLKRGLPADYVTTGVVTVDTVDFCVKADIEIPKVSLSGNENWEATQDSLNLLGPIEGDIPGISETGSLTSCEMLSFSGYGQLYVEYRSWLSAYSEGVYTIASMDDLNALLPGIIHPDNPLKFALSCCLASPNAEGDVSVLTFTAVADPEDIFSWERSFQAAASSGDIYNIVPLTQNKDVISMCYQHVQQMSQAVIGGERVMWISESLPETVRMLPNDVDTSAQAIVLDDLYLNDGKFNELQLVGASIDFVKLGIIAGDIVRYNFSFDLSGNVNYKTAKILQVVNTNTIIVDVDFGRAISVPFQVEIWHEQTDMDIARQAAKTGGYKDKRVRYVFPDTFEVGSYTVDGSVGCAIVATLSSSVVPQQGITKYPITGITGVPRTRKMSQSAMDFMAENGVWIITQDLTGQPYTRHALTTGVSSGLIEDREEMCVRNMDSCTKFIRKGMRGYIGVTNLVESNVVAIGAQMKNLTAQLIDNYYTVFLGGQLVRADLPTISRDRLYRDRLRIVQPCVIPAPLNNIDVFLYYTTEIDATT